MIVRESAKKGLLVGVGLAFSLGWVWFPWLATVWQPHVAWGSVESGGGGTAFLLLLALGFPLGGVIAERLAADAEQYGRLPVILCRHARHLCHAATFFLLLLSLFLNLNGSTVLPGIWPYLIVPAAAVAYVVIGLYWCGRLIALPTAIAPAALCIAILAATAIGWAISFLSPRNQFFVYPLSILVAWLLSEALVRLEKPRQNRGRRPARRDSASASCTPDLSTERSQSISHGVWVGLAILFAAVGFAGGLGANAPAISPAWLLGLPFGLGACVPAFIAGISGDRQERRLLAFAGLCIPLAALLSFFMPYTGNAALALAEGFLSSLGLILLAGATDPKRAVWRAGMTLGACVLLMNCGWWLGGMAAAKATLTLAILPALAGGLVLLLPLSAPFLLRWRQRASGRAGNESENISDSTNGSAGQTDPSSSSAIPFTEEEQKLILLLARPDLSNQDIADRLFISRDTVRYHLKKLYAKTNTSNRSELVRIAVPSIGTLPEKAAIATAAPPV